MVVAKSLRDALEADTIILAVPFGEHREVAKALSSWEGKTVIDTTNAFVKNCFAAMGRGDKQGLLALFADDIEWIIPG